jgi:transposase
MKKKDTNKKPKIIKITPEQLAMITAAIKDSNLDPKIGEMVIDNISGNRWLVDALEKGRLTIKKLRQLFNVTTESMPNRRKIINTSFSSSTDTNENISEDTSASPPKSGHGRLAADAYQGAEIWDMVVPDLKPGDTCPEEACDGRLYEMSDPGVFIQITGSPVAKARRYNLQKLRCSVCEIIFTAPLPEGVEEVKYTVSLITMLMIHKYFMSMPLYRQETLQNYLGVPMPASTQWELMAAQKEVLEALYKAFEYDAAQGKGLAIDDTSAKIMEQIAKNKKADKKSDKASCYTTGIVSVHDDHMSYVFVTDNKTAGKSAAPFLRLRRDNLPTPYLMCDALTANIPEEIDSSPFCAPRAEIPSVQRDFALSRSNFSLLMLLLANEALWIIFLVNLSC